MASSSAAGQQRSSRSRHSPFKFIAMFVGTAVIGVALTFLAVRNASKELEIVHAVDNLHAMLLDRVAHETAQRGAPLSFADVEKLAAALGTPAYPVIAVRDGALRAVEIARPPLGISASQLERSRINRRGGYTDAGGRGLTWVQVAIPGSPHQLLAAHELVSRNAEALMSAYRSRLIVPAAFYIWMTVWVALILNNLTKRLRMQKDAVEHLALHDALTGLPNRNYLFRHLEKLIESARTRSPGFALAIVDLDKFKQVNDHFGHDAGDELLRQVADRFRQALRHGDLVARTGGDEFILVFPDSDTHSCRALCDRIIESLTRDYTVLGHDIRIGASMGVATYPTHAQELVELARKADRSMYAAKNAGGGVVGYTGE